MSIVIGDELDKADRDPAEVLSGHEGFALVSITAGLVREYQQRVARETLDDEPAHGIVIGEKRRTPAGKWPGRRSGLSIPISLHTYRTISAYPSAHLRRWQRGVPAGLVKRPYGRTCIFSEAAALRIRSSNTTSPNPGVPRTWE